MIRIVNHESVQNLSLIIHLRWIDTKCLTLPFTEALGLFSVDRSEVFWKRLNEFIVIHSSSSIFPLKSDILVPNIENNNVPTLP